MHVTNQGVPTDTSAPAHVARGRDQDALSRSSPTLPESTGLQPDRGHRSSEAHTVAETRQPVVAGQLAVRWEHEAGMLIMWLSGELGEATVTLLDRELDSRTIGLMGLVVDLTSLEFIDSPGVDALVGIHWRASKRGDRLSFRHGRHVAQRPIELIRTVRRLSRRAAPTACVSAGEDPYFALAMAYVSVDRPRSGDRPEAA